MNELPRPLAITGVTLIDGTGRSPLANTTVVIDGERFSRIGSTVETPAPEGADIIDGRGRFVIPGLTDMHVHVLGSDRYAVTHAASRSHCENDRNHEIHAHVEGGPSWRSRPGTSS